MRNIKVVYSLYSISGNLVTVTECRFRTLEVIGWQYAEPVLRSLQHGDTYTCWNLPVSLR